MRSAWAGRFLRVWFRSGLICAPPRMLGVGLGRVAEDLAELKALGEHESGEKLKNMVVSAVGCVSQHSRQPLDYTCGV
eukprot:COSAG01_NODE_8345_length_2821_cov_11.207568_5_plen_78_part_00